MPYILGLIFLLLITNAQANNNKTIDTEKLAQCDINNDGRINTKKDFKLGLVSKKIAKTEFKCGLRYDIAKLDEDIAKGKEDIAKGKEDIAKGKEDIAKGKEDIAKLDEEGVKIKRIIELLKEKEKKGTL